MDIWPVLAAVLAFIGSLVGPSVTGLKMPGVGASSKPGKKAPGIPLATEGGRPRRILHSFDPKTPARNCVLR